jgi:DNA ligase D-like protein (predicted ligase)
MLSPNADFSRAPARAAKLGFVSPLLPTLVAEPPAGDGWLHEIKHDGYRTLVVIEHGRVRVYTRRGHDWTDRYASIAVAAAQLPCRSAILDGETIVQDAQGVADFHELRRAIESGGAGVLYYAFDLLHVDGCDLRSRPLVERRALLHELIGEPAPHSPLRFSDHFEGDGAAFFAAAEAAGVEGIVSKRVDSRYRSGRSDAWRKAKCETESEFVVIGAEPNRDGPPYALLARETDSGLVYAGSAFVTLSQAEKERFWPRSEAIKIRRPVPTEGLDTRKRKVSWFKPEMRVRARHMRGGDMLRHARLTEVIS